MLWESETGAISAEKILPTAVPETWVTLWGIEPTNIEARLMSEGLPTGVTAVRIDASGRGSALRFHRDGAEIIESTWVLIPVVFEDGTRLRSGVFRLFFRQHLDGPVNTDRDVFEQFVRQMDLRATLWGPREFYMFRGGLDWRGDGESVQPSPPRPAGGWQDDLPALGRLALDPTLTDAHEHLTALRSLHERLPANPFFARALHRAENDAAEQTHIEQWLRDDPGGQRTARLRALHASVLDHLRQASNPDDVSSYLDYLGRVWPEHGLAEPAAKRKN